VIEFDDFSLERNLYLPNDANSFAPLEAEAYKILQSSGWTEEQVSMIQNNKAEITNIVDKQCSSDMAMLESHAKSSAALR